MDSPRILVVSTVHRADDTRIREKLIPTLAPLGAITYATRSPAPSSRAGIERWSELSGGRLQRNLAALRLLVGRGYDVAITHDPELLPACILAGVLGRRVVFDLHENVPGQLLTKEWLPAPARRPLSWAARSLLRLAERTCSITLAEPGYATLFARQHPVFANYPDELPAPQPTNGAVVYVGDVTTVRGVPFVAAALAVAAPTVPLRVIGPCSEQMAAQLTAANHRTEVVGPLPHPEAMAAMATAAVGVAPLFDTPNYRYSLPTKVIEYLGSGVPVVASDLPGTRNEIGGLPGVRLVPPGDASAWQAALSAAIDQPDIRNAAQANAAAVRERFRWPAAAVTSWYRELLTPPR
jgi:glycosyltransferase involved in cell wall biosynthesis